MWFLVVLLSMMLTTGRAAAFDCVGVTFPPTVVLCSDPDLMRLADERQAAINEARARIGEQAWPALWEDQKRWVRTYAAACGVPPDRPPPSPVPASVIECFKRAGVARTIYLRAYGLSAGGPPAPVRAQIWPNGRIGPSFDCSKATTPLMYLICGDADLSRLDLAFNQAYWALSQQLGPTAQSQLKEQDIAFIDEVQGQCGLMASGPLTGDVGRARHCVENAYQRMRAEWIGQLTGPAREEAVRPPEKHLKLQQDLQELRFLAAGTLPRHGKTASSVGETRSRTGRRDMLAKRAARQERRDRTDQCQRARDDECGVKTAGCGDDVAGYDRRQHTEGIAAEDKKGGRPSGVCGRTQ